MLDRRIHLFVQSFKLHENHNLYFSLFFWVISFFFKLSRSTLSLKCVQQMQRFIVINLVDSILLILYKILYLLCTYCSIQKVKYSNPQSKSQSPKNALVSLKQGKEIKLRTINSCL